MSAELKEQFWIYCNGQRREAAVEIGNNHYPIPLPWELSF